MNMRSLIVGAGLPLIVLAAVNVSATATDIVTFQDDTFMNAHWTAVVEVLNGGGSVSAFQVASGGNPANFCRIDNTLNSANGTGVSNSVFGFHALAGAVHDPASEGAILSIDYREDSQRIAGGVQACGLALRQGGVIYYGPAFLNPTTYDIWALTTQTGLGAGQFDALAAGVQNPDFSSSSSPIEFGFYRANSTSVGGGGGTTSGGIDNWRVDLMVETPVATTASTWGGIKALFSARDAVR